MRSLLFVPGDRADLIAKALRGEADALILDLEDSVAPSRKAIARVEVAQALAAPRGRPLFVRINPVTTSLVREDIAAIARHHPDGIVLPKAEGAASLTAIDALLASAGDDAAAIPILPIATETPAALFRIGDYAGCAARLAGLTWGAEDLPAAIGATAAREPDGRYTAPIEFARSLALFGAHAAGVAAIETVYPDFRDLDGLRRYAERGVRDGFTSMMAIHPAQVPIINAAFTPTPDAIAHARAIIAAFAAKPDAGVLAIDGRMIDAPHLKQAKQLLVRAGGLVRNAEE